MTLPEEATGPRGALVNEEPVPEALDHGTSDGTVEQKVAFGPLAADDHPPADLVEPVESIPARRALTTVAGPEALPTSPSQLAAFGDRGALRPVPGKVTSQPGDLLAQVPDTAIEWMDRDGLAVRGVSVRGHVHRYEGSIRQDQLAMGQVGQAWVLAVADGLGSQAHSHLGAAIASRFISRSSSLEALLNSEEPIYSCAEVASIMRHEAESRGLDPRSISTTLTFAVVDPRPVLDESGTPRWWIAVAQVGDSHAYLLRDGRWDLVTPTGQKDDLANVVDPLPRHTEAAVRYLEAGPGDVLALTTDGVGNLLEDQSEFGAALASLWVDAAPSPAALLYVVDGSVKSYDDDRTFLAIRFGRV